MVTKVRETAIAAAKKIVDGYESMNKMLPLAGGIPQPIERSTDNAVVCALEIMRLFEWLNITTTPDSHD